MLNVNERVNQKFYRNMIAMIFGYFGWIEHSIGVRQSRMFYLNQWYLFFILRHKWAQMFDDFLRSRYKMHQEMTYIDRANE